MDDGDGVASLTVWAFGTFHVAALAVVLLLFQHADGGLGSALDELDTPTGIGLYLYLWGVTWLVTHRTFRDAGVGTDKPSGIGRTLGRGALGGSGIGVAFLLGALLALFLPRVLFTGPYLPLLLVAAIGSVVAAIAGGIVGVMFAVVDLGLLAVAERLVERGTDATERL